MELNFLRNLLDPLNEKEWRRDVRRVLFLSFVITLIAAHFSSGIHHWDEHFQIVEFAFEKLGGISEKQLAWEYGAGIRPWLQPYIAFVLMKASQLAGLINPFDVMYVLRLFAGVFAWVGSVALVACLPHWLPDLSARRLALYGSQFLFYVPMIHVRMSSENFSTAALCLALCFFVCRAQFPQSTHVFRSALGAAGVWSVLATFFRFQSGILIAGGVLYALKKEKLSLEEKKNFLKGTAAALVFCFAIDALGYGKFTFSAWNYLYVNIFQDVASRFGTSPWHAYFEFTWNFLKQPFAPILMSLGAWGLATTFRNHLLLAMFLPFLVVHCFIGHKELRFLFPMLQFLPIFCAGALVAPSFQKVRVFFQTQKSLRNFILSTLVLINILYFFMFTLRSQWPSLAVAERIFRMNSGEVNLAWYGEMPFQQSNITFNYFLPRALNVFDMQSDADLANAFKAFQKNTFFFVRAGRSMPALQTEHCALHYSDELPAWLEGSSFAAPLSPFLARPFYRELYRCKQN